MLPVLPFVMCLCLILTPAVFCQQAAGSSPQAPAGSQPANQSPATAEPQIESKPDEVKLTFQLWKRGFGRPLRRVEIVIGTASTYTGRDGKAEITVSRAAITKGTIRTVLVRKHGYDKQLIPIAQVMAKQPYPVYLLLGEPDDSVVTISGRKRTAVSKKTISIAETARIAPAGDPVQVAKILPGVRAQPFSNEIVIRGSGPEDSKFFVDDLEVYRMFHLIGNFSIMPERLLKDVEFYSGGFESRYGNATGGIIRLTSNEEIPEHPFTEFRFNVPNYVTILHDTPLSENSSLVVSLRKSIIEYILPPLLKNTSVRLVPHFADGHVRYISKDDNGQDKISLIMSTDGIDLSIPSDEAKDQGGNVEVEFDDSFFVLGYERKQKFGGGWRLTTTPQLFYIKNTIKLPGDAYIDGRAALWKIPTELRKRLGKRRYLTLGIEPGYNHGFFNVFSPQPPSSDDDPYYDPSTAPKKRFERPFDYGQAAAWISYDFNLLATDFTVGARYQYFHWIKASEIDPRLRLKHHLTDNTAIKAAVGQFSKAPEINQSTKAFGNPDMDFEKSNHYILGIESELAERRWTVDGQIFFKRTYRLVRSHPEDNYRDEGSRETKGFELFVRRNLTEKTFGWLSYTYMDSKERANEDNPYHISQFQQKHNLNLAASYKLTRTWELGTRFNYVSGNPYTKITGSTYDADNDVYVPVYDRKNPFSATLPSTNNLDLFATFENFKDTWRLSYSFGVTGISVGNRQTEVSYNKDYSKEEFSTRDLPPIPFFEIKGQL